MPGVTGSVLPDGVPFKLWATPLPAVMTINPGQAPATWFQTDPNSFTGYPERIAWNRPG